MLLFFHVLAFIKVFKAVVMGEMMVLMEIFEFDVGVTATNDVR